MSAFVLESPLLQEDDNKPTKKLQDAHVSRNIRTSSSIVTVAKLAASFFCVYSAMDALSEYITSLLPGGLGDESLFLLQAAVCVSTLAAPAIVSSIGELRGIMLGGAAHVAYLASLVIPSRYVVLGSSIFCGFGASLTWVAQGTFLTKCTPPSKRGLYTGVFWGIYSLSSIVGNLTAFLMFKYLCQAAMFGFGTFSALVGVLLLLLMDKEKQSDEKINEENISRGNTNGKKALCETEHQVFPHQVIPGERSCLGTAYYSLLLFPITFYLGCQTAFWTGEFPKLLPAKSIGIVLFFTGLGQVIGSFFLSWLSDYLRCSTPTFLVGAAASGTGLAICFPLLDHRISNYKINGVLGTVVFGAPLLAYIAGLLFGIADGVLTSHVFAITGKIFQGSKPEIWALFNLLGTAGAAVTFWIGIVFPISHNHGLSLQVWIQFIILFVGSPLYVISDLYSANFAKPSPSLEPLLDKKTSDEPMIVVP